MKSILQPRPSPKLFRIQHQKLYHHLKLQLRTHRISFKKRNHHLLELSLIVQTNQMSFFLLLAPPLPPLFLLFLLFSLALSLPVHSFGLFDI